MNFGESRKLKKNYLGLPENDETQHPPVMWWVILIVYLKDLLASNHSC